MFCLRSFFYDTSAEKLVSLIEYKERKFAIETAHIFKFNAAFCLSRYIFGIIG